MIFGAYIAASALGMAFILYFLDKESYNDGFRQGYDRGYNDGVSEPRHREEGCDVWG
jgi:hypothetical protein